MEKQLLITCPCERQKQFEKTVILKEERDGVNSLEIPCLICGDLLSLEVPATLANDVGQFRGIKKT